MYKQKRISEILAELQRGGLSYRERNSMLEEIHRQITLLRVTDEVRTERLTVQEEVDNGLFFLRNTIWNTIPTIYEDLADALRTYYGKAPDLRYSFDLDPGSVATAMEIRMSNPMSPVQQR